MGLMSSKIERDELSSGDHIYTWRRCYLYFHHGIYGIYVGHEKVIHLTRGPGIIIDSDSAQSSDDHVVCSDMEDFLCDRQLYRLEYGVSRLQFFIRRRGTCSLASSDPPEQVLHRAYYLLQYGFGNYNLLNRNCEDFAIYCKTSLIRALGFSGQISSLLAAFNAVAFIPYRFLPTGLIGVALAVWGLYCFARFSNEAGGERNNFDVVEVEKLADLSDAHNIRENMNMMENSTTTRWFLRHVNNNSGSIAWAIRIWYWTPENTTLLWLKSCLWYFLLFDAASDHLKLHGFKLGGYSAYTIWLLGHLYWSWTSVSTIFLFTRSFFLSHFVISFVFNRQLELQIYVDDTWFLFLLWHWTPRIIIFQWIKLALVYNSLFKFIFEDLRNHHLMYIEAFFVCFVIQSVALFLETRIQ